MNGDRRVDLVTGNQQSVGVVIQHSRRTLEGVDWFLVGRALSYNVKRVAVGDVSGDGRPEIAVAGGLMHGLFLFPAAPTFATARAAPASSSRPTTA